MRFGRQGKGCRKQRSTAYLDGARQHSQSDEGFEREGRSFSEAAVSFVPRGELPVPLEGTRLSGFEADLGIRSKIGPGIVPHGELLFAFKRQPVLRAGGREVAAMEQMAKSPISSV
jgi:hypothetical protein